jgi:hypothetical protein
MRALMPLALAAMACGGVAAPVSAPTVVVIPAPGDEVQLARAAAAVPPAACPPDTLAQRDVCVRVVPSPEIPSWQAPAGHLDPCATWTSERGLLGCDPANEDPRDAGAR